MRFSMRSEEFKELQVATRSSERGVSLPAYVLLCYMRALKGQEDDGRPESLTNPNYVRVAQKRIFNEMGIPKDRQMTWMRQLKAAGLIRVKRFPLVGKRGGPIRYVNPFVKQKEKTNQK